MGKKDDRQVQPLALQQLAPIGISAGREVLVKLSSTAGLTPHGHDHRAGDGLEQRHVAARVQMAEAKKCRRKGVVVTRIFHPGFRSAWAY